MNPVETCSHLKPSLFFDLSTFSHRALFDGVNNVWEALSQIKPYLETLPLGHIAISLGRGVYLESPELISIGEGTIVEPGVLIRGPCWIGKNCELRTGAYLRGGIITGDNCIIGHTTEIKNSLLLDGVKAPHFAYLGDSILGNRVNLGAGVKCANLRLDHAPIYVTFEGKKIPTKRKKMGAIIGDDSQLGCNCVTNPGTLFLKGSGCYPCLNVGGTVLAGQIMKKSI